MVVQAVTLAAPPVVGAHASAIRSGKPHRFKRFRDRILDGIVRLSRAASGLSNVGEPEIYRASQGDRSASYNKVGRLSALQDLALLQNRAKAGTFQFTSGGQFTRWPKLWNRPCRSFVESPRHCTGGAH